MSQKQCTACAGTGRAVVAAGSGLQRSMTQLCTACGGSGWVYVRDAEPSGSRSTSSSGASITRKTESLATGTALRGLFGVGGFILGALLGAHLFDGNWVGVLVSGFISGWIAAAAYKVIIGLALVVLAIAAFTG